MKIIVNTKKSIPVEIGELNFEISLSDENIERIYEEIKQGKAKMSGLKNADIKQAREGLIEIIDVMLGEGAGAKIYEAYPSIIDVSNITKQLLEQWAEETAELMGNKDQQSVMNEYVKKKK